MKDTRLDKFLSENTDFSRSELKKLIKLGKAQINGETVKSPEYKIDALKDEIVFCSKKIQYKKFVYILMNKPRGVLSASNDKTRETVVDLVPQNFKHFDLFPVGRLDKDTTGLLIITNDGEYAHKVISPKSLIEKSYIASVDEKIPENIGEIFKSGVILADGYKCSPAKAEIIDNNTLRIVITEGKYHQIKRMLGRVGLGVEALHRERIGKIILPKALNEGQAVELTQIEAYKVFDNA